MPRQQEKPRENTPDDHRDRALGLIALAYQGITYTSRETIVDLGPIKANADRQRTIPLPPILGTLA